MTTTIRGLLVLAAALALLAGCTPDPRTGNGFLPASGQLRSPQDTGGSLPPAPTPPPKL